MANQNVSRRQWIVRPRFQIQFAVVLVLLHINVGFLYQVALHYRMRSLAEGAGSLEAFLDIDPWTSTLPAMAFAALLSGVIVFFIGIRYSNQIVGPIPRISRVLREMSQGKNPSRLKFRPGDVLEELASDVNLLADSLHGVGEAPRQPAAEAEIKVDPASIVGDPANRETIQS